MKGLSGIKYITAPILETNKITHAFLTRCGGISKGVFSSLNFSARDGDSFENVAHNAVKTGRAFNFDASKLILVKQVHKDNVLILDKQFSKTRPVFADAITTNLKGVPIGVLTADCLPIILFDPVNTAVGIVHAGWKGTLKRIVQKALSVMTKRWGSSCSNIRAGLGPCIGKCCYNVDYALFKRFRGEFPKGRGFTETKNGSWQLNLKRVNYEQLLSMGLQKKNIWVSRYCASCKNGLFFSYRKDNKTTGRQLSFVMINHTYVI